MDVVTVRNQQMEAYSVKLINHEHDVMATTNYSASHLMFNSFNSSSAIGSTD